MFANKTGWGFWLTFGFWFIILLIFCPCNWETSIDGRGCDWTWLNTGVCWLILLLVWTVDEGIGGTTFGVRFLAVLLPYCWLRIGVDTLELFKPLWSLLFSLWSLLDSVLSALPIKPFCNCECDWLEKFDACCT